MGYYTAFGYKAIGKEEDIKSFEKELLDRCNNDYFTKELLEDGCVYAKLYEIEDNISVVARNHPDVLIILTGDGESRDDLWEHRWKGNENERQNAEIPPFTNPSLVVEDKD